MFCLRAAQFSSALNCPVYFLDCFATAQYRVVTVLKPAYNGTRDEPPVNSGSFMGAQVGGRENQLGGQL